MKHKLNPVSKKVLVEHKIPIYEGKIIFPETYKTKFFYAIVVEAAPDCDKTLTKDTFILAEWNGNKQQMDGNFWLVDESSIILVQRVAKWHPFGNRVMIIRDNDEKRTEAGLIITNQQRENTQSLYGTVIALGYKDNKIIESNVKSGDYIMLTDWHETHREIKLYNNYMLTVYNKFIAAKVERV